jgi:hypothetical protein
MLIANSGWPSPSSMEAVEKSLYKEEGKKKKKTFKLRNIRKHTRS